MYEIELYGISFFAYHGVNADEKENGQAFSADVVLEISSDPSGLNDDISRAVSYSEVNDLVIGIATGRRYNLIESLADAVGREILSRFPAVSSAAVTIHKPNAPIKGVFDDVAIRCRLSR